MSEMQADSDSWLLRTQPTAERWGLEVHRVVLGIRDDFIAYFGSAAEYVRSLIFNSPDRSASEFFFQQALRRLAEFWHPLENPDTPRDLRMLQLLGAFTPEPGMGRTLKLLGSLNAIDLGGEVERVNRLKVVALQVMEQYFPVEQAPVGAFQEYVAQLEANLKHVKYAPYAVARLHDLHRLDSSDPRLGKLIENAPDLLSVLLPIFVANTSGDQGDIIEISFIYTHCLHASALSTTLSEFQTALLSLGVRFMDDLVSGPCVEFSEGGLQHPLLLSEADRRFYYTKVFLPAGVQVGKSKFAQIAEKILQEVPPVSFFIPAEVPAWTQN